MGTGQVFTGADHHRAAGVADHGVGLGHPGGEAEAHAEIPVVLQLSHGVVGRGQIGHRGGVGGQGFPGLAHQVVGHQPPEAGPQEQQAQQHQPGDEAEKPGKCGFHEF